MPNLRISPLEGRALLDIGSFAKRGPGRRARLSPEELALIGRTVRRVPEVMVKVLSKDTNSLGSVAQHLNYIGRRGKLELETDDGTCLQQRDAGHRLIEDWDLDLDQDCRDTRQSAGTRCAPKLVHKIVLSMPPGTPATGLLAAARNFARQEFALKHRYALVLHTDEPHPHVHLVVRAVSDRGERLNIRKATLREWRREFARCLRNQGIRANATERAVRGEIRTRSTDGMYRAALRGDSAHLRARVSAVSSDFAINKNPFEPGKAVLVKTRKEVESGWRAVSNLLLVEGHAELAAESRQFLSELPPCKTDNERIADRLLHRGSESGFREPAPVRVR